MNDPFDYLGDDDRQPCEECEGLGKDARGIPCMECLGTGLYEPEEA